jgi:hypothetical protein
MDANRALAAMLFMAGYRDVLDTTSTLQSSPWTTENVAADEDMANSMKYYLWQTTVSSSLMGVLGSAVAGSGWPIGGTVIGIGYMWYIYMHALNKARSKQNTGQGWFKNG